MSTIETAIDRFRSSFEGIRISTEERTLTPQRWSLWINHRQKATPADITTFPFAWVLEPSRVSKFLLRKLHEEDLIATFCHQQGSWFMHTVEWNAAGDLEHVLHFEDQRRAFAFLNAWL